MSTQHAAVDAGTPALGFQVWERTEVRYHRFADLPTTKGEVVQCPKFTCLGHEWSLGIYPGGQEVSDDGMVCVCLENLSEKRIELDSFCVSVKNSDGADVAECAQRTSDSVFEPAGSSSNVVAGLVNFARYCDLMSVLVVGTLVLEVRMRCNSSGITPFVGKNPSWNVLPDMFLDEGTADVIFEFGDGAEQLHAHRFILQRCAPMLAARCPPGDGVVTVSVKDMAPDVFRPVLSYIYGRDVTNDEYKSHAREIIKVADRYEVVGLKLETEAWYAKSIRIDLHNVMELLSYSHAANLALLKEVVMDFIVANGKDILQKPSLNEVPEGLFSDVLAATERAKKQGGDASDITTMRISDLRKMLHEKGLGIDGSREALISALRENE